MASGLGNKAAHQFPAYYSEVVSTGTPQSSQASSDQRDVTSVTPARRSPRGSSQHLLPKRHLHWSGGGVPVPWGKHWTKKVFPF